MLLKDWCRIHGIKPYQMAKEMGISATTLYKSLNGSQRLSPRYAKEVEEFTRGAVSRTEALWPEDFEEGSGQATQMRFFSIPLSPKMYTESR